VDYRCAVDALVGRRRTPIALLGGPSPSAATVGRPRCFRGISALTAAGVCAEGGSFERFAKPGLLLRFLGFVLSEYTSDQTRVQGQITKAGSTLARRLLVEPAHQCRRRPRISEELAARQAGQDPRSSRSPGAHNDA
jgi:transposase